MTDQLELDRVDLLGVSMGAPVALAYAVWHPERVGRLILYGGFANGQEVASAEVRAAMIELVRAHWVPGARLVSLAGRSHLVYAGDAAVVVVVVVVVVREILGSA